MFHTVPNIIRKPLRAGTSEVQMHVRNGPKYLQSENQLALQLIEYEALNVIQFHFSFFHL